MQIQMLALKAFKTEDGKCYFRGFGGDAEPDYDPKVKRIERLSVECCQDLINQIKVKNIPLIPRHWERGGQPIGSVPEWDDELGKVVDMTVTPHGQVFPVFEADMDNSRTHTLFNKIRSGKKFGLSWGFMPLQWHTEFADSGMEIRVFDKIDLWHFAVTVRPVNSRTLNNPLEVIAKSVNWADGEKVRIDRFSIIRDYPEREAVLACYKSFHEEEGNLSKPVGDDEKQDKPAEKAKKEEDTNMDPKELAAAIAAALKSNFDELVNALKGVEAKLPAPPAAAPAAKSDAPLTLDDVKGVVEAALKDVEAKPPAPPAAAPIVEPAAKALKPEEIEAKIAEIVNKAVEPFMAGLKSKQEEKIDRNDPIIKDSPRLKAINDLSTGKVKMEELPLALQRELENLGAAGFAKWDEAHPSRY